MKKRTPETEMAEKIKRIFENFKSLNKEQQEGIYERFESETYSLITLDGDCGDREIESFLLDLRDLLKSAIKEGRAMKEQILVWDCKCERCGWKWISKTEDKPKKCPKCRSSKWNENNSQTT